MNKLIFKKMKIYKVVTNESGVMSKIRIDYNSLEDEIKNAIKNNFSGDSKVKTLYHYTNKNGSHVDFYIITNNEKNEDIKESTGITENLFLNKNCVDDIDLKNIPKIKEIKLISNPKIINNDIINSDINNSNNDYYYSKNSHQSEKEDNEELAEKEEEEEGEGDEEGYDNDAKPDSILLKENQENYLNNMNNNIDTKLNLSFKSKNYLLTYENLMTKKINLIINIMVNKNLPKIKLYIIFAFNKTLKVYIKFKKYFIYNNFLFPNLFDYYNIKPKIEIGNINRELKKDLIKRKYDYISNKIISFKNDIIIYKPNINNSLSIKVLESEINKFEYDNNCFNKGDIYHRKIFWLSGETGVGKSTLVRAIFANNYYEKYLDDSWENYNNEEIIIVEVKKEYETDLEKYFDIWTESYLFKTKDGKLPLYNKLIFICEESIENYFINYPKMIRKINIRSESIIMRSINEQNRIGKILIEHN